MAGFLEQKWCCRSSRRRAKHLHQTQNTATRPRRRDSVARSRESSRPHRPRQERRRTPSQARERKSRRDTQSLVRPDLLGATPDQPFRTWLSATLLPPQKALTFGCRDARQDRKSTRLNSSHSQISYAVFCLKKKNNKSLA